MRELAKRPRHAPCTSRRARHRLAPARAARLYRVGPLPIRKQQRPDIRRRLRRAEQIALHFRTAEFAQQVALLLGLDAFGGRRHVAIGGDVHHRLHDAGRAFRLGDVGDEAAVDLDLVERKTLQIAQRGIAGAEIVERNADADGAKVVQNGQRRLVVADEHGLGDLELQPARRRGRMRPAPPSPSAPACRS